MVEGDGIDLDMVYTFPNVVISKVEHSQVGVRFYNMMRKESLSEGGKKKIY